MAGSADAPPAPTCRRPAPSAGDASSSTCRATVSGGRLRKGGCSCRSRMAASIQLWNDYRAVRSGDPPIRARRSKGVAEHGHGEAAPARRAPSRQRRRRLDRPVADAGGAGPAAPRRQGGGGAAGSSGRWSRMVERYLSDERLPSRLSRPGRDRDQCAGTTPGPRRSTIHHASGRMDGMAGTWGYVQGGMGMVSFILCDIAREAGAVVAAGVRGGANHSGRGGGSASWASAFTRRAWSPTPIRESPCVCSMAPRMPPGPRG